MTWLWQPLLPGGAQLLAGGGATTETRTLSIAGTATPSFVVELLAEATASAAGAATVAFNNATEVLGGVSSGSGRKKRKTLPYGWWEETNAPEQEIAAAQEAVKAVRAELKADEQVQPQTAEALRSALWFADIDAKLSRITGERQLKAIEKQIAQAKAEYDRAMAEAAEREDEEDVELLLLSSI